MVIFFASICLLSNGVASSSPMSNNLIISNIDFYTSSEGANIISSDSSNGKFSQCIEYRGEPDFSNEEYTSNHSVQIQYSDEAGNQSAITIFATASLLCEEVIITASGEIVVVGTFSGTSLLLNHTSNNSAGFAIAIDPETSVYQPYVFDTNGNDRLYGLTASSFGEFILTGSTDGNISDLTASNDTRCGVNSTTCGIVVFLDPHFEFNFLQYVESNGQITCVDVEQKGESNQYLVTGYFSGDMLFNDSQINPPLNRGASDLFVSILDSSKQWKGGNTVGSSGSFRPKDVTYHQNEFLVFGEGIMESDNPAYVRPSGHLYDHGFGDYDMVIIYVDSIGIIKDIDPIGTDGRDGSGEMDLFSTSSIVFSGYTGTAYDYNQSTIGEEDRRNFFGGVYDLDAKVVTFGFSSQGSSESDARANTAAVLSNDSFFLGGRVMPFESVMNGLSSPGHEKTAVGVYFSRDTDFDQILDTVDNCFLHYNPSQSDFDADGEGDACDLDIDSDGLLNLDDPCNYSEITQIDRDGDGCFAQEDIDEDGDGVINEFDGCKGNQSQTLFGAELDRDRDGCHDFLPGPWGEDEDDDHDTFSDWEDSCNGTESVIFDSETWVDEDNDGCHDTIPGQWGEDLNDDNDAYNDQEDDCKDDQGSSTIDRTGCPDDDGDGYSNFIDHCDHEYGTSSEREIQGCPDGDKDGHADSYDRFTEDIGQWDDSDDDGYGDNPNRHNSDDCKTTFGTSYQSLKGCLDTDGDGWSNSEDALPFDSSDYLDSDNDGFGNSFDDCPYEGGNSRSDRFGCPDMDGDGYSDPDNLWTINDGADAFRSISDQWLDSDGDGYGDNNDGFGADSCLQSPGSSFEDRFGCTDTDGDGYSDSDNQWTTINGADAFVKDATQWSDIDKDGFGDNEQGSVPDACPSEYGKSNENDIYGCPDSDEDGYSDDDDYCSSGEEVCLTAILNGRASSLVVLQNVAMFGVTILLFYLVWTHNRTKKGG